MKELVEMIVRGLVDKPEDVVITETCGESIVILEISRVQSPYLKPIYVSTLDPDDEPSYIFVTTKISSNLPSLFVLSSEPP